MSVKRQTKVEGAFRDTHLWRIRGVWRQDVVVSCCGPEKNTLHGGGFVCVSIGVARVPGYVRVSAVRVP